MFACTETLLMARKSADINKNRIGHKCSSMCGYISAQNQLSTWPVPFKLAMAREHGYTRLNRLLVGSGDQKPSQPISALSQKAAINQLQSAAPFFSAFGQERKEQ